jgi:hypothetical protein
MVRVSVMFRAICRHSSPIVFLGTPRLVQNEVQMTLDECGPRCRRQRRNSTNLSNAFAFLCVNLKKL